MLNDWGKMRISEKTCKELGLVDYSKDNIGHAPVYNVPNYTTEGEVIRPILTQSSGMSEGEKEFLTKSFSSEPEEIEDFQYVKPIKLTTVDEILSFLGKD